MFTLFCNVRSVKRSFHMTVGTVITCKAAVAWGPQQPLCTFTVFFIQIAIEEIQVAPPKVG
jgi:hypothetical protein